MAVDATSRWKDLLVRSLAPPAARWVYQVMSATYRYRPLHGERMKELAEPSRPVLLCFWHDQALTAARFLYRRVHRCGRTLSVLASHSRDGELVTRLVRPWGLRVVRGSSSRGGKAAILGIYRSLVGAGDSPVMLPDGPRGPAHRLKSGVILLSRFSGTPILPLAFVPRRCWRLGSWDRMAVPLPGSRIAVVLGELHQVPRELDSEGLEKERRTVEAMLEGLVARGRCAVGGGGATTGGRASIEAMERLDEECSD